MNDFKTDNNNKILQDAVKSLCLRFPVAEIQRKTGYEKGSISNFLSGKKPVSDNFLKTFSEAFNIKLDSTQTSEIHIVSNSDYEALKSENLNLKNELTEVKAIVKYLEKQISECSCKKI